MSRAVSLALRSRGRVVADRSAEDGFTLIEMMVVLLIMAILLAIAVPTFLGVKVGAQDRSAQSDLINSAIEAKNLFANDGSFVGISTRVTELQNEEPEMTYTTDRVWYPPPPHEVAVYVSPDNNVLLLVDQSPDGRCWVVEVNEETTANVGVPMFWTSKQGISYGATTAASGQQTFCRGSAPTRNPGNFAGWGYQFPA